MIRTRSALFNSVRKTAVFLTVVLSIVSGQQALAETREENALRLIAQANNLKTQAAKLHGKAETSINNANRLSGEAHSLTLKIGSPQFKSAVAQYSGDLTQFREHAVQYNVHLADFQKTIGECHAGEAAYENSLKDFQLHVNLFHIPDMANIRPPHVCGRLKMTEAQTAQVANQMRNDQVKIIAAEKQLNAEEVSLRAAQSSELLNSKKAVNAAIRDKHEQELAAEFGKLKEEYDLLKMENQALGGANSKIVAGIGASTSVQGKINSPGTH